MNKTFNQINFAAGRKTGVLWLTIWIAIHFGACFRSDKPLTALSGGKTLSNPELQSGSEGLVSGKVLHGVTGQAISDVNIALDLAGTTPTTTSDDTGAFSLAPEKVVQGDGTTVRFRKQGFRERDVAIVFTTESLTVEMGDIYLFPDDYSPVTDGPAADTAPVAGFAITNLTVNEDQGDLSFTVRLNKAATENVSINYTISGSADSADHNLTDGQVTIPAGQDSGQVDFAITDDSDLESDETLIITLDNSMSGATPGDNLTLTFTIADNETFRVNLRKSAVSVQEGPGLVVTVELILSKAATETVTIPFSFQGTATTTGAACAATGDAGDDYHSTTSQFQLNAGETSDTANITICNDTVGEPDEELTLVLGTPSPAYVETGGVYYQTISLADNERTITGQVLNNLSANGLEGATVDILDSALNPMTTTTDTNGFFSLTSENFLSGSSYNLTLSKTDYISRSDITVDIATSTNIVNGSPVSLYKNSGAITGFVRNNESLPLVGVTVSVVDGRGDTVQVTTDGGGFFRLNSDAFFIGETYPVEFSLPDYQPETSSVTIGVPGDNIIADSPLSLPASATITGQVNDTGALPLAGVAVSTDCGGTPVETTTDGSGAYTLESDCFAEGVVYSLDFSLTDYLPANVNSPALEPGENPAGTTVLSLDSGGSPSDVHGNVRDYWYYSILGESGLLSGVTVEAVDENFVRRSTTTDGSGAFTLSGAFQDGNSYTVEASLIGYTGETLVSRAEAPFTMTGTDYTLPAPVLLYPRGVFLEIQRDDEGSPGQYEFTHHRKQSYEKFLTDKQGFTFSARDDSDLDQAGTFYLHFDWENGYPGVPEGQHSNYIGVNATPQKSILAEGIGGDTRAVTWNVKNYVYHHFYVSSPGSFTIQTTGGVDTQMNLYNSGGGLLVGDNNSGSGSNALISTSLGSSGWYFLRIVGNNDSYGFYDLAVTGPDQGGDVPVPRSFSTASDAVLSWYDITGSRMYIAAPDESPSSGTFDLALYGAVGEMIRGSAVTGSLRAVDSSGKTAALSRGFFNLVRTE